MKKILIIFLALLLATLFAVGCTNNDIDSGDGGDAGDGGVVTDLSWAGYEWVESVDGEWSVNGEDELVLDSGTAAGLQYSWIRLEDRTFSDFVMEFEQNKLDGETTLIAGTFFRSDKESGEDTFAGDMDTPNNLYNVGMDIRYTGSFCWMSTSKHLNGMPQVVKMKNLHHISYADYDVWNKIKIIAQGSHVTVLVNDYYALEFDDPYHTEGYVFLNAAHSGEVDMKYKNFTINDISGATQLDPPSNLSATDGTLDNEVELTWDSVTGADSYFVYRTTDDGGSPNTDEWTVAEITDTNSYTEDADILDAGGTFWYKVKAFSDTAGLSDFSNEDSGYANDTTILIEDFESYTTSTDPGDPDYLVTPNAPWVTGISTTHTGGEEHEPAVWQNVYGGDLLKTNVLRLLHDQLGDPADTGYTYAQYPLSYAGSGTLKFYVIYYNEGDTETLEFWSDLDEVDIDSPPTDADWTHTYPAISITYYHIIEVPITCSGTCNLTWKGSKDIGGQDEDNFYIDNIRFYPD